MIAGTLRLPEGRQGQALAIAMTLLAAALVWFAAVAPLLGWYEGRAALLTQQREIAAHMAVLSQEIPALNAAISAAGVQSAGDQVLLAGGTDAIAGANLKSALQNLATQAGTSLDSAEELPVQHAGALHRIGIQVRVTATWPVLISLLEAISIARPRMIVDQLSVIAVPQPGTDLEQPMQAVFLVSGFCAGPR